MVYFFKNRVINYVGYFVKVWKKNLKSMGYPFLIGLAKAMQHIIFYAHVHACSSQLY